MSNERIKILEMLSQGKISVDDAADLIAAASSTDLEPRVDHELSDRSATAQYTGYSQSWTGTWMNWANNLNGMKCSGANFENAFFVANNLESTNLCHANVEDVKVFATNLDSAIFEGANLRGTKILFSNLDGANFRNANLEGVTIIASNFDSANMEGADLHGQSFICTNMDGFNRHDGQTIEIEQISSV